MFMIGMNDNIFLHANGLRIKNASLSVSQIDTEGKKIYIFSSLHAMARPKILMESLN